MELPHFVALLNLIFLFFLQIIDELLDVENNPRKPQYTMASGRDVHDSHIVQKNYRRFT